MNYVSISGRLGADVELKKNKKNDDYANVSLALREYLPGDAPPTWVRVQLYGKVALAVAKYRGKGSMLWVIGKIKTTSYIDEKTKQKVYSTYVAAKSVEWDTSGSRAEEKEPTGGDDDAPF